MQKLHCIVALNIEGTAASQYIPWTEAVHCKRSLTYFETWEWPGLIVYSALICDFRDASLFSHLHSGLTVMRLLMPTIDEAHVTGMGLPPSSYSNSAKLPHQVQPGKQFALVKLFQLRLLKSLDPPNMQLSSHTHAVSGSSNVVAGPDAEHAFDKIAHPVLLCLVKCSMIVRLQATELLAKSPSSSARQIELMKAVPEMETVNCFVGGVKLAMPGMQQRLKRFKKKR